MERNMGSTWTRYSYGWVTLGFFLISIIGHWLFGWFAYVDEQTAHGQPIEVPSYLIEVTRDTLENWQSEFLQLLWQVGGLAFLLFLGSPQSKEGHDRIEAKIDEILRHVDPTGGDRKVAQIDELYLGRDTDARHHGYSG
jgi:hypothetical protein